MTKLSSSTYQLMNSGTEVNTLLASYPGSSSAGEEPGYGVTLYEVTLTK